MEPIIEIKNISKKYRLGSSQPYLTLRDLLSGLFKTQKNKNKNNQIWAVNNLSMSVMSGEVVGIIGNNGAGKSTLLKILSQITPPTKGEIILRGRVASLLEVGTGFHPELTGRENIYLNGAILGMKRSEIKKKFNEIIEFASIEKFLDTPVKHYSSGMYMRLAFSIAAHLEPEILLVDEVLAVGDVAFQKKCLGKMGDVAKSGRTVIFVSHNMSAVKSLCQRVIWIDQGKIKYSGPTEKAVEKYLASTVDQSVPLAKRKDREGDGAIKVESFGIFNQENSTVINVFDCVVTKIKLKFIKPYKKLQLRIAFIDISGRTLFRIDSDNISSESLKNQIVEFKTSPINLAPCLCWVNIGVFADGQLSDYIKNVTSFNIVGQTKEDVKLYESDISTIILKHRLVNNNSIG